MLECFEPEPLPVHLVHQEGLRVMAELRYFLDFAQERLRGVQVLGGLSSRGQLKVRNNKTH